ncbi:hypothetical protein FRB94_004989 [Tulasnella sp. JGI-2019a]|nr:hypothetical protein FRB94_004989 [Tulasnella sp. JGI-2019a]
MNCRPPNLLYLRILDRFKSLSLLKTPCFNNSSKNTYFYRLEGSTKESNALEMKLSNWPSLSPIQIANSIVRDQGIVHVVSNPHGNHPPGFPMLTHDLQDMCGSTTFLLLVCQLKPSVCVNTSVFSRHSAS